MTIRMDFFPSLKHVKENGGGGGGGGGGGRRGLQFSSKGVVVVAQWLGHCNIDQVITATMCLILSWDRVKDHFSALLSQHLCRFIGAHLIFMWAVLTTKIVCVDSSVPISSSCGQCSPRSSHASKNTCPVLKREGLMASGTWTYR